MKTLQLKAVKRAEFGKKAAKAFRREGLVPCMIYGGGEEIAFTVDAKEVKPLIYTPNSYIVELDIDGKIEKAVMREVQFHPRTRADPSHRLLPCTGGQARSHSRSGTSERYRRGRQDRW